MLNRYELRWRELDYGLFLNVVDDLKETPEVRIGWWLWNAGDASARLDYGEGDDLHLAELIGGLFNMPPIFDLRRIP